MNSDSKKKLIGLTIIAINAFIIVCLIAAIVESISSCSTVKTQTTYPPQVERKLNDPRYSIREKALLIERTKKDSLIVVR